MSKQVIESELSSGSLQALSQSKPRSEQMPKDLGESVTAY